MTVLSRFPASRVSIDFLSDIGVLLLKDHFGVDEVGRLGREEYQGIAKTIDGKNYRFSDYYVFSCGKEAPVEGEIAIMPIYFPVFIGVLMPKCRKTSGRAGKRTFFQRGWKVVK